MLGDATGRDGHFKQPVGESRRDAPCLKLHQRAKREVPWTVSTQPLGPRGNYTSPKSERPQEANELLTEKSQQSEAAPLPTVPSCYFSSTWWSFEPLPVRFLLSKLKQQLLAVDGEPTAQRTPHTHKKAVRSVLHPENKGTSGTSSAVPYKPLQQEGLGRRCGRQ